ncbi:MAG: hypothetical protein PUA56_06840 [Bacillales bacterium]|nr:hypothetical protein [Bacillales bacterium]
MGFLPIEAEYSNSLFQLISMRYEKPQQYLKLIRVLFIGVKCLKIQL